MPALGLSQTLIVQSSLDWMPAQPLSQALVVSSGYCKVTCDRETLICEQSRCHASARPARPSRLALLCSSRRMLCCCHRARHRCRCRRPSGSGLGSSPPTLEEAMWRSLDWQWRDRDVSEVWRMSRVGGSGGPGAVMVVAGSHRISMRQRRKAAAEALGRL